jgi:hypothetical protein
LPISQLLSTITWKARSFWFAFSYHCLFRQITAIHHLYACCFDGDAVRPLQSGYANLRILI